MFCADSVFAVHFFHFFVVLCYHCSQWVKEDSPILFNKIKQAVKDGRFLIVGGSWVEMDCNLPSG